MLDCGMKIVRHRGRGCVVLLSDGDRGGHCDLFEGWRADRSCRASGMSPHRRRHRSPGTWRRWHRLFRDAARGTHRQTIVFSGSRRGPRGPSVLALAARSSQLDGAFGPYHAVVSNSPRPARRPGYLPQIRAQPNHPSKRRRRRLPSTRRRRADRRGRRRTDRCCRDRPACLMRHGRGNRTSGAAPTPPGAPPPDSRRRGPLPASKSAQCEVRCRSRRLNSARWCRRACGHANRSSLDATT